MSSQNNYYDSNPTRGGFVQDANSSPLGSNNGSPSNASKKNEAAQALRPMTIAQLKKCDQPHSDADWILDDATVGHVTVVAQVHHIQKSATTTTYYVEDGTGSYEVRHWNDSANDEDLLKWGGIEEGMFVRVTGQLKTFGTKRYVNTNLAIRPAINKNNCHEIDFHFLECIAVTLQTEHGSPSSKPKEQTSPSSQPSGGSTASAASLVNNKKWATLPHLERKILEFMLAQDDDSPGTNVGTIAVSIGTDASDNGANKVSLALDRLMDDGIIYTTLDESTFKVSR